MNTTLLTFSLATGLMTFLGGLFSLRFKDKSHLITSFSAGVVIGLAFFDLIPEALEVGKNMDVSLITTVMALGFVLYLLIDRLFSKSVENQKCDHEHGHKHENHIDHEHSYRGVLRASSLIVHSFLDGVGIGFAFQVSTSLGILVAVAVLAHDFSDGINTITAVLKDRGSKEDAIKFLLLDSIAPIIGIMFTLFFVVSQNILAVILAIFAGFFLYIGASDLIPESYHNHPTKLTTVMTILGMLFMFLVITFAA